MRVVHAVEVEDFDFSYGLYADEVKMASFAGGRAVYREWAIRSRCINPSVEASVEDRYDHDVDELLV